MGVVEWGCMKAWTQRAAGVAAVVVSVVMTSCARIPKPQVYGEFDAREKSIAVPIKNVMATQYLKTGLRNDGWRVVLNGTMSGLEGTERGSKVIMNPTTRYTMVYNIDPMGGGYDYMWGGYYASTSLSIFENRTGEEVLNYSYRGGFFENNAKMLIDTMRYYTK